MDGIAGRSRGRPASASVALVGPDRLTWRSRPESYARSHPGRAYKADVGGSTPSAPHPDQHSLAYLPEGCDQQNQRTGAYAQSGVGCGRPQEFRAGAWRLTVEGPPEDPITGKRRTINRTVREPNTKAGAKAAASELARLIVEVDVERRRPSALRDWRRSLVSGSLGLAGCDLRAATPWVGLCSPCEPWPASSACRCSLQLTVRPASRRTMRAIYETVPRRESSAASLGLWRIPSRFTPSSWR